MLCVVKHRCYFMYRKLNMETQTHEVYNLSRLWYISLYLFLYIYTHMHTIRLRKYFSDIFAMQFHISLYHVPTMALMTLLWVLK